MILRWKLYTKEIQVFVICAVNLVIGKIVMVLLRAIHIHPLIILFRLRKAGHIHGIMFGWHTLSAI